MQKRHEIQQRSRLGTLLIHKGLITREQLDQALTMQSQTGMRLGEALISNGWISQKQLDKALRKQSRYRLVAAISAMLLGPFQPFMANANAATDDNIAVAEQTINIRSGMQELSESAMSSVTAQGAMDNYERLLDIVNSDLSSDEETAMTTLESLASSILPGTNLMDAVRAVASTRTKLVSIPHVSRNNGRRITDEESATLAAWLRERDIRFHLDGAQGPGCVPVDFRLLGCDYYSACGHKWLLGPKGTGAFFCHEDVLDRTKMSWTGSHSTLSYDQEGGYELIPEARRFEFGTRALATFAGFDAALSWMESIGMDRILKRVDELVAYAEESWQERGHTITSPIGEARSGVLVIQLTEPLTGWQVYESLRSEASTFTSPVDGPRDLRIAIHFINMRSEIDATFDAIESLL